MGRFLEKQEYALVRDGSSERAPVRHRILRQSTTRELLADTKWDDLDLLTIDLPPGGEQLPATAQLLPDLDGVILRCALEAAARELSRVARAIRAFPGLGGVGNAVTEVRNSLERGPHR